MRSAAPVLGLVAFVLAVALAAADEGVVDRGWIILAVLICAAALWTPIHLLAYLQVRGRTQDSPPPTRLHLIPLPDSEDTEAPGGPLEAVGAPSGFWIGQLRVWQPDGLVSMPLQLALGCTPPAAAIIPVEAGPGEPRVAGARLIEQDDLTDEVDLEFLVSDGRQTESVEVHLSWHDGRLIGGGESSGAEAELKPAAAVCLERLDIPPAAIEIPADSAEESACPA